MTTPELIRTQILALVKEYHTAKFAPKTFDPAIPERLAEAIGPKTKAIMMAHTMGVPFHLDTVMDLVKKHNLWLIEDNCDALGSTYTPSPLAGEGRGEGESVTQISSTQHPALV
ncbi:MAG: DegT/DnrJ/EryC1/StrS family aminotransferase [Syntrophales bacterium]|nr:DegT/DnrJ/EryC1/StrS family aminotransferase [Syntrophales bacterium]